MAVKIKLIFLKLADWVKKFLHWRGSYREIKSIPPAVAALIPSAQLDFVKRNLQHLSSEIIELGNSLKKCPGIKETDKMDEHPAVFHYFFGSTDIYVCEYDRKDLMFGYAVLGGDLQNSEWGYISLKEIRSIDLLEIDFYLEEQSIEAALYSAYPAYFEKPPSFRR